MGQKDVMQQQMSRWQAIPCPFLFPSIIALFYFLFLLKEKFVLFVCNLQFKTRSGVCFAR